MFKVEEQDQGMRLDKFLVTKLPEESRSRLQGLIADGHVSVNQLIVKEASYKVKEGQEIDVAIPPSVEAFPSPQQIPLDILYEDKDVIVINKPAGMVVHPAPGHPEGTLVNALLNHCGDSLSGINGVKRPGIVHRIDKETSGLLVAAKNDRAHHHLSHQLSTHKMGRVYVALVWGMLIPPEGIIEGLMGRDPRNRQRMALRSSGKFSKTHYKVLKYFGKIASLVECRLETGRTHQIRVHFTSKNHPLIGDIIYGSLPRTTPTFLKTYLKEKWPKDRHALHAKELSFIHPTTHETLLFSTDLPEDMRNMIDVLNLKE